MIWLSVHLSVMHVHRKLILLPRPKKLGLGMRQCSLELYNIVYKPVEYLTM